MMDFLECHNPTVYLAKIKKTPSDSFQQFMELFQSKFLEDYSLRKSEQQQIRHMLEKKTTSSTSITISKKNTEEEKKLEDQRDEQRFQLFYKQVKEQDTQRVQGIRAAPKIEAQSTLSVNFESGVSLDQFNVIRGPIQPESSLNLPKAIDSPRFTKKGHFQPKKKIIFKDIKQANQ